MITNKCGVVTSSLRNTSRHSKKGLDQLLSTIPDTVPTSVGDVMLNQVAPSLEICMNSVMCEVEKSEKQSLPLSEVVQETRALQTEVGALKKRMLTPQTPADEDFLILIAEGKVIDVITTVSEERGDYYSFIFIHN